MRNESPREARVKTSDVFCENEKDIYGDVADRCLDLMRVDSVDKGAKACQS